MTLLLWMTYCLPVENASIPATNALPLEMMMWYTSSHAHVMHMTPKRAVGFKHAIVYRTTVYVKVKMLRASTKLKPPGNFLHS